MPRILLFTLVLVVAAQPGAVAHRHRPGEVAASFAQAWNQHNAADVAALFTEEGSLAHPFAASSDGFIRGRESVAAYLKAQFGGGGLLAKSTYEVKTGTLRESQLRGLVVLDFEATIAGVGRVPQPLDHRVTMVLEQSAGPVKEPGGDSHGEHFSIAAMRLMVPAPDFIPKAGAAR
jgi:hypothetical protein